MRYKVPKEAYELLVQEHGEAAVAEIMRWSGVKAMTHLNANLGVASRSDLLDQLAEAGLEAVAGRYAPGAVWVMSKAAALADLPQSVRNSFVVQNEASVLSAMLGDVSPDSKILVLGGKAKETAELSCRSSLVELLSNRLQF